MIVPALGAHFHKTQLPQIMAKAKFQPKTAFGKLKAVMTPTNPKGFHCSIMKCSFLSLGMTYPLIDLDSPQAKSHTSIVSWTSPIPSAWIFPISKEMIAPRSERLSLKAFPISLTISPLFGIGREAQAF